MIKSLYFNCIKDKYFVSHPIFYIPQNQISNQLLSLNNCNYIIWFNHSIPINTHKILNAIKRFRFKKQIFSSLFNLSIFSLSSILYTHLIFIISYVFFYLFQAKQERVTANSKSLPLQHNEKKFLLMYNYYIRRHV